MVAFSVAYEHDYINLAACLELARIPLWSKDRKQDDPLVLVGGAVTLLNPEPIADFVDVFCLGEAEGVIAALVAALRESAAFERRMRLERLSAVPGLYVPSLYLPAYCGNRLLAIKPVNGAPDVLTRSYLSRDDYMRVPASSVVMTEDTEFGFSFLIEVSRGCPYVCRYCTVGFSYPKVRWKPWKLLWQEIEAILEWKPKVGLISATVGNHPEIEELCQNLIDSGVRVSFSSLRADRLPDAILDLLVAGGGKTLTLAPETGSYQLRKVINKRFSDECYLDAAKRAFLKGIKNLRMYAMVGLPGEREEHIRALVRLVKETRRIQEDCGRGAGRITLSVGLFVPKPATPYQWIAVADLEVVKKRMRLIRSELAAVAGVKVAVESPKWSLVEAVLARADRRMSRVIARVLKRPGFNGWVKSLQEEGLSVADLVYRERAPEELLPWFHLGGSWTRERLYKDRLLSKRQEGNLRDGV